MKVSVLIPWRTDKGQREKNFWRVVHQYKEILGKDIEIVVADSGDEIFNRAASRNAGFSSSTGDIVIFADADTLPTPSGLNKAIEAIHTGSLWAYPFDMYYSLTEGPSRKLIADESTDIDRPSSGEYDFLMKSIAGVLVFSREAFIQSGGYNEDFVGWGYEDDEFNTVCGQILGHPFRANREFVVHLWHPRTEEETWEQPNIEDNLKLSQKIEGRGPFGDSLNGLSVKQRT
jgi:predicted glycosyltransferase involved in capsule biosynthesis